jgi:enoyl-CoA hydratase
MDYENIIYEKGDYIARITLNRPERMNAFSTELSDDIGRALSEASNDDEVKVIIMKGAGRALCAGADLTRVGFVYNWKTPKHGEAAERPSMRARIKWDRHMFWELTQQYLLCPKVTIAQAHGYVLGAGYNFFQYSDLIIASEDCKFGHVEERLGMAGMTIAPMMVLRCGLSRALELCITGRMVTAKEAARIGLINAAVPADKLEAKVNGIAEGIARFPRDGIALGKTARHWLYDIMGVTQGLLHTSMMHTMGTNIKFERDEFNFFKARRDIGATEAAHKKHEFYAALDEGVSYHLPYEE